MNKSYDYLYKLVIVGNSGVGKSSILIRFADDLFSSNYISTIGVDFRFRTLQINNKIVKLQIWDTAVQERFRSVTSAYYKGADAIILCYDITNMYSFRSLDEWISQVKNTKDALYVIVGNKCDEINREVAYEHGKQFADENNCYFVETSAKDSTNIDDMFTHIANILVNTTKKCYQEPIFVNLEPVKIKNHKTTCCVK